MRLSTSLNSGRALRQLLIGTITNGQLDMALSVMKDKLSLRDIPQDFDSADDVEFPEEPA